MYSSFPTWAKRLGVTLVVALLVGGLALIEGNVLTAIAQGVPPIDQVISQLEGSMGFFNVYRTKDGKLAFEVTASQLGKDFLVVVQMAKGVGESPLLTGYPLDSDMMTFRLRNDKIELVSRNPLFTA